MKDNYYQAVVGWQVVEHLSNPEVWINNVKFSMKKNGFLFLSTPNATSFQAKLLSKFWPHLDAPRHQIIYTSKALINTLKNSGFELVYVNWGIDTLLWNRFSWITFFSNLLHNTSFKFLSKILGTIFFFLFFLIEIIPGQGSSFIHVYKKIH